jgi:UDP-N-acetylmuramoyl-tripeptide--D-alanyl-D-alanine ligase
MWPITGAELLGATGGRAEGIDEVELDAITIGDLQPAPGQLYVPVQEDVDGHAFVRVALERGVSLALVRDGWDGLAGLPPALAARCVRVPDPLAAFRALAAFLRRRFSFPVLAIAGSNGKTTTKELCAALVAKAGLPVSKTPETMNGFTGVPFSLCRPAHRADAPPAALVLEIGVDAAGAMAEHAALAAPDVAAITALGAEHLAGLGSIERAAEEELALFAQPGVRRVFQLAEPRMRWSDAREGDVLVSPQPLEHHASVLHYEVACSSPRAVELALTWRPSRGEPWRGLVAAPVGGAHNAANLALAFAAVLATVPVEPSALAGWLPFRAPGMRCQVEDLPGGAILVDDAYNASPESLRAAVELLDAPMWRHRDKCLVLGDMLDLGVESARYHAEAAARVPPGARVVAVGEAMRAALPGAPGFVADAPAEAIVAALAPPPGAVVLVKGSRGVRLERVCAALRSAPPRGEPEVVVVGHDAPVAARIVAAAIGAHAIALAGDELAAAPACSVAVLTRFVVEGPEPERQLALVAQPFLRLRPGGHAVLNADDEASALLAEVIPSGVAITRYTKSDAADEIVDGVRADLVTPVLAALAGARALGRLEGAAEALRQVLLELRP